MQRPTIVVQILGPQVRITTPDGAEYHTALRTAGGQPSIHQQLTTILSGYAEPHQRVAIVSPFVNRDGGGDYVRIMRHEGSETIRPADLNVGEDVEVQMVHPVEALVAWLVSEQRQETWIDPDMPTPLNRHAPFGLIQATEIDDRVILFAYLVHPQHGITAPPAGVTVLQEILRKDTGDAKFGARIRRMAQALLQARPTVVVHMAGLAVDTRLTHICTRHFSRRAEGEPDWVEVMHLFDDTSAVVQGTLLRVAMHKAAA